MPAILHFIKGEVTLTLGDDSHDAGPGTNEWLGVSLRCNSLSTTARDETWPPFVQSAQTSIAIASLNAIRTQFVLAMVPVSDRIYDMATETPNPKQKSRWLRYSVRTFWALMAIAVLWIGLFAYRVHKQRQAVAWIKEMGGTFRYDYEVQGKQKPPGPDWFPHLIGFDYFADVLQVNLFEENVTDVSQLANLPDLQKLSLTGTRVAYLEPLSSLDKLRILDLESTPVSDLRPLASLDSLEELTLDDTQVKDLSPLAAIEKLKVLKLTNAPVRDVTPLAKLKNLVLLVLNGTQVSDVTPLASTASLDELWLIDTRVRDVRPLSNLTSLETLGLDNSPVKDVSSLTKLTSLRLLSVDGTQVTKDDYEVLCESMPHCVIYWLERDSQ
jgi:Leucine-rich repeat (LRR) protein